MNQTKLEQCMERFPQTKIWMDSFDPAHHAYAVAHGCVGITTSPTWVAHMVEDEFETQLPALQALCLRHPTCDERELLWRWTLEMGRQRSACMLPIWERGAPKQGRFAIQVDVYRFRDAETMTEMALQVHRLGPNMQVKIPCTAAGIRTMEEATYRGVSVMATLCYTVAQAVAAAQAIERGMHRRTAEGLDNRSISPVCAVLLGMQEDWLRSYADAKGMVLDPEVFGFAGEAICKRICEVFGRQGYETQILVAYYRHHRHWSAFMGGDIIMTIPHKWQEKLATCQIPIADNMSVPVDEAILAQLRQLEPFVRAWEEHGLPVESFDTFGPVVLTLQYFQKSYDRAVLKLREVLLPDPF